MTTQSVAVLAAILSAHTGALIALAIVLGRTREKLARVEEWVRVLERQNGLTRK